MGASFSPVVKAVEAVQSGNFSVKQLDLARLWNFLAPVRMFDHYRMSGPTFAPRPHAGLSAVSYIFEDSAGAMHNRDSLGHSVDIKPGEIVWTQVGIEKSDESVLFVPKGNVHLLLLSGEDSYEPVAAYGPFIMNTQEGLVEAFERYRVGKMGRLDAVRVSWEA